MEWIKHPYLGDCECTEYMESIVSMGIARQLHVRIIIGMVVHRPGIRILSFAMYLSGIVNWHVQQFDSLFRSRVLGRNLWE
jgi:hypothetical protein